jgi:hypothetical protein
MAVTAQNTIPLVQNGTLDIGCGPTTNNTARQQQVAFALTTYVSEVRMATKVDSGITTLDQLAGRNVSASTGTTAVQLLRKRERAQNVSYNTMLGKDHLESFLLMESGRADAFVLDDNLLAGIIANSKSPASYRIVGEALGSEPIALLFRKDDPGLQDRGGRLAAQAHEERRPREDLHQVVRGRHSAEEHQPEPADEPGAQAADARTQRQAAGSLREVTGTPPCSRRRSACAPSACRRSCASPTMRNALKRAGRPVIVLGAGEPDFDTPQNIREAAVRAIERGDTRYTVLDGSPAMKAAVQLKFRRDNALDFALDEISVSAGAKQVIFNALMASLDPGDEVILPAPYWTSYADIVQICGGVPVSWRAARRTAFG